MILKSAVVWPRSPLVEGFVPSMKRLEGNPLRGREDLELYSLGEFRSEFQGLNSPHLNAQHRFRSHPFFHLHNLQREKSGFTAKH